MSIKSVTINGVQFGGGAPVRVESMLKTRLDDVSGCVRELEDLRDVGCELVRVAFPDVLLEPKLAELIKRSQIPLMADIHFSHKYALAAIDAGCRSIRINPGNMGRKEGLMEMLQAARANGVVIRIGSNGGSLDHRELEACGGDRSLALFRAVESQLLPLLDAGFEEIILSAKSSSVRDTVAANLMLAQKYTYPLHVGITEAGPGMDGAVKSAVGLGILLSQGVGETMRVSLTGPSIQEVEVAYTILQSLNIRRKGVEIISCPTCGRRRVEVVDLVKRVRAILNDLPEKLPDGTTVAVMGCEVNGPKEAADADIGIAGTQAGYVLFCKGKVVMSGPTENLEYTLRGELEKLFRQ